MQAQQHLTKTEFAFLVALTLTAGDLASHLQNERGRLLEFFAFAFFFGAYVLLLYRRQLATLQRAEAEILSAAYVDSLTGLPNRRAFFKALEDFQASLKRGRQFCVGLLDLDRFKPLNDLYGHRVGDEVLRVVGRRLKALVGEQSIVARIGGDEFGIIVPGPPDSGPIKDPIDVVNKLQEPVQLAALSVGVGASLGLVWCSGEMNTTALSRYEDDPIESTVRRADMALYRAKKSGNRCEYFKPQMDDELRQRIELEHSALNAVRSGEIVPYYQPVIDLKSGETRGFEVLARWVHAKNGILLPSVFLSSVKATGAICEMTYSLMKTALADVSDLSAPYTVSINMDPIMLGDRELIAHISHIASEFSFPLERLQFEITEWAFLSASLSVLSTLKGLRDLGVRVAIDNFGGRHSGFSYVQDFKVDGIKIDRSLANRMLTHPADEKIVRAMIDFGHALGLEITAEGIECLACRNLFALMGCELGQGFYFGYPSPTLDAFPNIERESNLSLRPRLVS